MWSRSFPRRYLSPSNRVSVARCQPFAERFTPSVVVRTAVVLVFATLFAKTSHADVLNFEQVLPGTILQSVTSAQGQGPIYVHGVLPTRHRSNSAVVFDSSDPSGGDLDLGTPNQACGGPGDGTEVGPGTMFENCEVLGNVLIVAQFLDDSDGDGRVDDPDDADYQARDGIYLSFDFSALGVVSVESVDFVDIDGNGPNPRVELFGRDGALIRTVPIPNVMPNNGKTTVNLGPTPNVQRIVAHLNGSAAIDNIRYNMGQQPPMELTSRLLLHVDGRVSRRCADLGVSCMISVDDETGLGSVEVSLSAPGPHTLGLLVDYELDEETNTFFNEYGSVENMALLPAGLSWEIDEPGFVYGDILEKFTVGNLDNANGVGNARPNDVAMALMWTFELEQSQTAKVGFSLSDAITPDRFGLIQRDSTSEKSISLSSRLEHRRPR